MGARGKVLLTSASLRLAICLDFSPAAVWLLSPRTLLVATSTLEATAVRRNGNYMLRTSTSSKDSARFSVYHALPSKLL